MNANGNIITTSRFRTATHALTWLAMNQCVQSSASLAGQVNSHAAFLRRVLLPFVQAGFVEAREGRDGGYMLKVSPEDLTLADVFMTVNLDMGSDSDDSDCGEAGIQLDKALDEIAQVTEQQVIATLQKYTLADLLTRMN
jgi:Rrf2 family transcriptional regulator, repressor of oqxAB